MLTFRRSSALVPAPAIAGLLAIALTPACNTRRIEVAGPPPGAAMSGDASGGGSDDDQDGPGGRSDGFYVPPTTDGASAPDAPGCPSGAPALRRARTAAHRRWVRRHPRVGTCQGTETCGGGGVAASAARAAAGTATAAPAAAPRRRAPRWAELRPRRRRLRRAARLRHLHGAAELRRRRQAERVRRLVRGGRGPGWLRRPHLRHGGRELRAGGRRLRRPARLWRLQRL